MDREKARKFINELNELQHKYGIRIASTYEEEIDYDYEGNPYVNVVQSYLMLVDKEGNEIIFDDILSEFFSCYYCGKETNGDDDFCSAECKKAYKG